MNASEPPPKTQRRLLALAGVIAAVAGIGLFVLLRLLESPALPSMELRTLAGAPVDLATLGAGKPTVLNLWATWCPPCRQEMPVLAAAQHAEAGVNFVFADQGEDARTVERYLKAERLDLSNVMLDPAGRLGREFGSMGLPITLFYDAGGRMVDSHLGALSESALASRLARLRHGGRRGT